MPDLGQGKLVATDGPGNQETVPKRILMQRSGRGSVDQLVVESIERSRNTMISTQMRATARTRKV
jgi:hypothetical protein